jgi:hypothetical protein
VVGGADLGAQFKYLGGGKMGTKFLRIAMTALLVGGGVDQLYASEGVTPSGPLGGTDIQSALLPPPGLYGFGVGLGVDFSKFFTSSGEIPAGGGVGIGGLGFLYVYDAKLWGGTIGSSVFGSYQRQ